MTRSLKTGEFLRCFYAARCEDDGRCRRQTIHLDAVPPLYSQPKVGGHHLLRGWDGISLASPGRVSQRTLPPPLHRRGERYVSKMSKCVR